MMFFSRFRISMPGINRIIPLEKYRVNRRKLANFLFAAEKNRDSYKDVNRFAIAFLSVLIIFDKFIGFAKGNSSED
jgi:hypothetical protein